MVSLFDKAKERLRRKDSDSSSRSSSLTRSSLSLSRKSKEKDKKSGLKFKNRAAQNSKDSISAANSKRNSRIIAKPAMEEADLSKPEVSASETGQLLPKASSNEPENTTPPPTSAPAPEPAQQPPVLEPEPPAEAEPALEPTPHDVSAVAANPNEPVEPSIPTTAEPPAAEAHAAEAEDRPKPPDENAPLLVRPPPEIVETSSYLSSPIFSITVVVLILLIILGYFVYINAKVVVMQSVHPQLNSVKIMAFTSEGLDVNVDLNVAINYTNISNVVYQSVFTAGGFLLSKVAFRPQLPVEITLNSLDSFNVTTPKELVVGLHNGDITSINFNSTVQVSDTSLIKLLNDLLSQDEVEIHVTTRFKTDVGARGVWIRNRRVSVDQDFIFVNNMNSQVEISNESLTVQDDKIEFESLVKLNNPYLSDYVISESKFSVFLPDCDDNLAPLGEVHTSRWNMSTNNFSIRGVVTEVAPSLLQECSDGYSPLNRLAQAVLNEAKSDLVLTCDTRHKYFPDWLNNVINNVKFRTNRLPLTKFPASLNYSVDSVDLQLADQTLLSSNISVNLPIGMRRLRAQFSLDNYVTGSLAGDLVNGVFPSTFEVESVDRNIGDLLSTLVQNRAASVNYEMLVDSVHVQSSLVDAVFKDLNVTGAAEVGGFDIERLHDFVAIRVDEISHLKSDKHSVELLVVAVASNPSNFSLDLAHPVAFDVSYNATQVAHVEVDRVYAPANGDFAVQLQLRVDKSKHNEAYVTEFLNKYVSGSQHIPVTIEFGCEDQAVEFLNEVRLPALEVPAVAFLDRHTATPFVLEATIHLIGSDVELEILNPIDNLELDVYLEEVVASYEGTRLGATPSGVRIKAPPGISTTQRIPIKLNPVGLDILKRAVDGKLAVMVDAKVGLAIGKLELQLNYRGDRLESNIRL